MQKTYAKKGLVITGPFPWILDNSSNFIIDVAPWVYILKLNDKVQKIVIR